MRSTERTTGISELVRVTRPGGRVLVSVMSLVGTVTLLPILLDLVRRDGVAKNGRRRPHRLPARRSRLRAPGDEAVPLERAQALLSPHGTVVDACAAGLLPPCSPRTGAARVPLARRARAGRQSPVRSPAASTSSPVLRRGADEGARDLPDVAARRRRMLARGRGGGRCRPRGARLPVLRPARRRAGDPARRRARPAHGMRTGACLEVPRRDAASALPGLRSCRLTYSSLLEAHGWERFAADAQTAGATRHDRRRPRPLDERPELRRVQLVAPTSTDERLALAAAHTRRLALPRHAHRHDRRARTRLSRALAGLVARSEAQAELPLYAGFGISTPEHARAARRADGRHRRRLCAPSRSPKDGPEALRDYVSSLRVAPDA